MPEKWTNKPIMPHGWYLVREYQIGKRGRTPIYGGPFRILSGPFLSRKKAKEAGKAWSRKKGTRKKVLFGKDIINALGL